ncbi:Co2+/Mg2+ efflux protein ApaG [Atopomonas sediminilitoris]|uniref:Co2+/Mg2+ efflux protein ApaG n=1 Tax=Atopomonas sediminilitoris TaxID=2919919 RepID=UPI001F4E76C2|nr:Co2+/Mg2+ efflux protein ApaG [Atopomonas sediminilitoris]MCJ8170290.1 Co2+/Mg2+ efflux protein ApaG [Atopomonas sediminilitoris]
MTEQDPRYHISVTVVSRYLPEQSLPDDQRYAFAYTVTVRNLGLLPAQLMTRHWIITDGNGKVQEVRGAGVIGEQPLLAPGQSHTYTSGTLLDTPVGSMHGSYRMQASDEHSFDAPISPFRLAKPGVLN